MRNVFIALFLIVIGNVSAQPYKNSVGIRAGYSSGFIYKHFISRNNALEGLALYNNRGFQVSAMYEYQFSPYSKERLQYYGGIGPHAGNWNEELSIGISGILGAEFIFRKAPVILGMEWKPMFNIQKEPDLVIPDIGLVFTVVLN